MADIQVESDKARRECNILEKTKDYLEQGIRETEATMQDLVARKN